jgi:hypothetical protein
MVLAWGRRPTLTKQLALQCLMKCGPGVGSATVVPISEVSRYRTDLDPETRSDIACARMRLTNRAGGARDRMFRGLSGGVPVLPALQVLGANCH